MIYIFQICWISKFRNKTDVYIATQGNSLLEVCFYLPLGGGVSSSEPEELSNDEIL